MPENVAVKGCGDLFDSVALAVEQHDVHPAPARAQVLEQHVAIVRAGVHEDDLAAFRDARRDRRLVLQKVHVDGRGVEGVRIAEARIHQQGHVDGEQEPGLQLLDHRLGSIGAFPLLSHPRSFEAASHPVACRGAGDWDRPLFL